jgi:hypothetical protein
MSPETVDHNDHHEERELLRQVTDILKTPRLKLLLTSTWSGRPCVQFEQHGQTRGGNDKWSKVGPLMFADESDETHASVLRDLASILDTQVRGLPVPVPPPTPEDTATAILAGLVETVRVMRENAYAKGLTGLFADYDHALIHLTSAAEFLPPSAADAYTNPVEKVEQQAREAEV